MKVTQMLVTLKIAKVWLEKNRANRRVSQAVVLKYASEMRRGKWLETHMPIAFNGNGELIDGQHRLLAIIAAKVDDLSFLIARELEGGVFSIIDTGKKRNLTDILSIAGVTKNSSELAVLTKLWFDYKALGLDKMFPGGYGERSQNSNHYSGNTEYLEFYKANPEIYDLFEFVVSQKAKYHLFSIFSRPIIAFWYGLFREKNQNKAQEFIARLIMGDNLGKNDPIYIFREKGRYYRQSGKRLNRKILTIFAVKTWNYWLAGDEGMFLRVNSTTTPKIM